MKKIIITALSLMIFLILPVTANAKTNLLNDEYGLLTGTEAENVRTALNEVSNKYDIDVAVTTCYSTGDKDIVSYADDYYDERYDSGVMLLIAMEDRDWYITTYDEGIKAFTDYGIEKAGARITPSLSSGDYEEAFLIFAEIADEYFYAERNGSTVKAPFPLLRNVLIAIGAGLVIGLIYASSLKGQLKTVVKCESAANYVKKGSLTLKDKKDTFLYSGISKIPIPQSTSGGSSGSSTHTSSSGRTHGGGGGKF